jgi:L-asparaginase
LSDLQPETGHVVVLALGGTIAMSRRTESGLVVPELTAEQLMSDVPGLPDGVAIKTKTVVNRPGASLTIANLVELLQVAREAVDAGALGIVVTQGTDTMEETSFVLDLLWNRSAPLVMTGAMRNPTQAGADGAANLLAAVAVAASDTCRDLGCLVVMNDVIHAARYVRKEHSSSPAAFVSPSAGPLGAVVEGHAVTRLIPARPSLRLDEPTGVTARVALVEATLDDDGDLLCESLVESFDGLVIAGFGAGHLSETAASRAVAVAAVKPVILASRCGAGGSLRSTYGFVGSESYLLANGLISAGDLDARKARLLLLSLLSAGADRRAIGAAFNAVS